MIRFLSWSALWVGSTAAAADRTLEWAAPSDAIVRHLAASAPTQPKLQQRSLFGGYTNVICSLSQEAYPAIWNEEDKQYYLPDIKSRLENKTDTGENDVQDTIDVIDAILGELEEGEYEIIRLCWCTQYAQLPFEFCSAEFDTCMVTAAPDANRPPVSCYKGEMGDTVVRSFKPIFIFWVIALLYAWFCTVHGRTARAYLRRMCCSNPAEEQLDALLQQEPDRASYMYHQHIHRVRRDRRRGRTSRSMWMRLRGLPAEEEEDDDSVCEETQLKLTLKTKIYHEEFTGETTNLPSGSSDEQGDEENGVGVDSRGEEGDAKDDDESSLSDAHCIICLLSLEEGDVIGDIPCGHLIHKDCLKDWLRRKNRCPLCQQNGIATLSTGTDK